MIIPAAIFGVLGTIIARIGWIDAHEGQDRVLSICVGLIAAFCFGMAVFALVLTP